MTLQRVVDERLLTAVFQPIVDLTSGQILGYEGLVRGPRDGSFHEPTKLIAAALEQGLTWEVERLCRQTVIGPSQGIICRGPCT